jgi:hypothetical protein
MSLHVLLPVKAPQGAVSRSCILAPRAQRTKSERSVVVVDVVLVVFVADGDHSGHGHVYVQDLPRLSRDHGLSAAVDGGDGIY